MKVVPVIVLLLSLTKCIDLVPVERDPLLDYIRGPTKATLIPKIQNLRQQRSTVRPPLTTTPLQRTSFLVMTKSDKDVDNDGTMHLEIKMKNKNDEKKERTTKKPAAPDKKKKLPATNKPKNKKDEHPIKIKNPIKDVDDEEEGIFTQGYKKVFSKITNWWKALDDSFSDEPSKEGGNKVKKETKQSKDKPTAKPNNKKKPPKKITKAKPEGGDEGGGSWFDLERIVVVLGGIVTVLDLFGIR